MADTTYTSTSYHVQVVYDPATTESVLNFRNRRAFRISSSQQYALWAKNREIKKTGDNPTTLGWGGLIPMHITHSSDTNEAVLYMGQPAVRMFHLLPSQWGVLLSIDRELSF